MGPAWKCVTKSSIYPRPHPGFSWYRNCSFSLLSYANGSSAVGNWFWRTLGTFTSCYCDSTCRKFVIFSVLTWLIKFLLLQRVTLPGCVSSRHNASGAVTPISSTNNVLFCLIAFFSLLRTPCSSSGACWTRKYPANLH